MWQKLQATREHGPGLSRVTGFRLPKLQALSYCFVPKAKAMAFSKEPNSYVDAAVPSRLKLIKRLERKTPI